MLTQTFVPLPVRTDRWMGEAFMVIKLEVQSDLPLFENRIELCLITQFITLNSRRRYTIASFMDLCTVRFFDALMIVKSINVTVATLCFLYIIMFPTLSICLIWLQLMRFNCTIHWLEQIKLLLLKAIFLILKSL